MAAQDSFPFIARSLERLEGHNSFDIQTVKGGSHCFMQEDPKAAAKMIKEWFA